MGILYALIPLAIMFGIFFAVYKAVPGKRTPKLKKIGWLELLVVYLMVLSPWGLLRGMQIEDTFRKHPALGSLSTVDFIIRTILIFLSFYAGVCLWKASKGAVKKAKLTLIALAVFNVVIVEGVYALIAFAVAAQTKATFSASELFAHVIESMLGVLVFLAVVVSWYIYLLKSKRVREVYAVESETIL